MMRKSPDIMSLIRAELSVFIDSYNILHGRAPVRSPPQNWLKTERFGLLRLFEKLTGTLFPFPLLHELARKRPWQDLQTF